MHKLLVPICLACLSAAACFGGESPVPDTVAPPPTSETTPQPPVTEPTGDAEKTDAESSAEKPIGGKLQAPPKLERTVVIKPDSERKTGLVNISLLDEQNQPTAARVRLREATGTDRGALPGLDFFWAEGKFQARLLEGGVNALIRSGPRRHLWMNVIEADPEQGRSEIVQLQDYQPVWRAGWWATDPFVQAYTGKSSSEQYAFSLLSEVGLAVRGEGLRVAGLGGTWALRGQRDAAAPRELRLKKLQQEFADAQHPKSLLLMAWAANRKSFGQYYALETKPVGEEKTVTGDHPLFETLARTRDRNGLIVCNHPTGILVDAKSGQYKGVAGQLLFDMIAGPLVDAIDISRGGADIELWQSLLNQGYWLPAIGGGPDNRHGFDIPALGTYTRFNTPRIDADQYVESLRNGRTIVSNGPFVRVMVEGLEPGAVLPPSNSLRTLYLDALASSLPTDNIQRVELIYNGKVIDSWKGLDKQKEMVLQLSYRFREIGWLVARYYSEDSSLWAITNPIYFSTGKRVQPDPALATVNLTLTDTDTGRAVDATVDVFNLGARIRSATTKNGVVHLTSLPASARFVIRATGYRSESRSIFEHGGIRKKILELDKSGHLRSALLKVSSYDEIRAMLKSIGLTVRMASTSPPTE